MAGLFLRVDLGGNRLLGPGKVRLLEVIGERGSISAADRTMGISYRRAWLLVDEINHSFHQPAVKTRSGGGAELAKVGREIIDRYRAIERDATRATAEHLAALAEAAGPADDGQTPGTTDTGVSANGDAAVSVLTGTSAA